MRLLTAILVAIDLSNRFFSVSYQHLFVVMPLDMVFDGIHAQAMCGPGVHTHGEHHFHLHGAQATAFLMTQNAARAASVQFLLDAFFANSYVGEPLHQWMLQKTKVKKQNHSFPIN